MSDSIREAPTVSPSAVRGFHAALSRIEVVMPKDPDAPRLRAFFEVLRRRRNAVMTLLGRTLPVLGALKADRERVKRITEKATAACLDRFPDGYVGATRPATRIAARTKILVSDELDALASLEADIARVSEVVNHARMVLGELEGCFNETSRTLATLELEWRITHGER